MEIVKIVGEKLAINLMDFPKKTECGSKTKLLFWFEYHLTVILLIFQLWFVILTLWFYHSKWVKQQTGYCENLWKFILLH